MSADMESLGILFELQWKKKPGGNNREDVASIGIWDTPDASLDWMTFKSYVCQNLGTTEDIYVAYIDSDGDELPIESECEFKEALKFARQRASKGREVVLKVDKRGGPICTSHMLEPGQKELSVSKLMTDSERDLKKKHTKVSGKSTSKTKSGDKTRNGGSRSSAEERKLKTEDHTISNELGKMLACSLELEAAKRQRTRPGKDDSPPPWFKKYMEKFKSEIVAEVTTNVMYNTRQILESTKMNTHSTCRCVERNAGSITTTKTKKKKSSDEDSSDGALSSDQRDHKLLKKIEKLHKREKKLEKKLDSKLEKLENKTKRRMEKKFQYKSCSEQPSEKKANSGTRKRMGDGPVGTYLMDAIPLNHGPKPAETHIRLGERFTKMWEIMNNGILPWTDKTALRLAWGTSGLEPEATILKCPILMPGEKGVIAVTFRAPEFPGTFESYWHFYHMGDRFGHWLGCAVIVDSKEPEKQDVAGMGSVPSDFLVAQIESNGDNETCQEKELSKIKIDQPVDLRMKYEPDQTVNSAVPKTLVEVASAYDRVTEDTSAEPVAAEVRQRTAEYESDSDDENLSVISGTISLTSDSEEDENFVVVPMPPCFMCDVPLEQSDAVPLLVKEQMEKNKNDKHGDIQNDLESNLPETSSNTTSNISCTSSTTYRKADDEQKCNVQEDKPTPVMSNETPSLEEPLSQERTKYIASARNEIYAVDMAGHCMPVDFAWTSHNDNHNNGTFNVHSKMHDHSSGNSSWTGSDSLPKQGKEEENKHDHSSKAKPSFHVHTTVHSQCSTSPFHTNFSSAQTGGDGQTCGTTFNCSTSSSTNRTQNGFQHHENQTSSSNTTQASSPNQPQDPIGAAVHILPETLVNGAINVASQAFTTARAVFSNLRSRPSEDFAEWHWNDSTANWSTQTDRSTTESLKILLEMGFTNKILNVLLLQRYDNDIAKVVAELLTYKDNPGYIYNRQTQ